MIEAYIYEFTEVKEGPKIKICYNIAICSQECVKTLGKRYSDFLQLHEHLSSKYPLISAFPFPKKSLTDGFLNKIKIASERKEVLNDYLCLLLSIESVAPAALEFLGLPVVTSAAIATDSTDKGTQIKSILKEELLFKISPKNVEGNATASRSLSSKRNMTILFVGVIIAILLITVIFTGKLRYFHGNVFEVDENVNSKTLGSCINEFLLLNKYWEIKDQSRQRKDYQIFGTGSFGIFNTFLSKNTKFWILILVFILIIFASFHRLLGIVFGFCMRHILGRKRVGSYLVEVEWIGLRLGFDRNEIVIHKMLWRNPPLFTGTPFFVSIEDIFIRFDMLSVLKAFFWDSEKCVICFQAEIGNMEIYLEKLHVRNSKEKEKVGDRSATNFWCAIASVEVEEECPGAYSEKLMNFISSKIGNYNTQLLTKNNSSASSKREGPSQCIITNSMADSSCEQIPLQSFPSRSLQSQKTLADTIFFSNAQNDSSEKDCRHGDPVASLQSRPRFATEISDLGFEKKSIDHHSDFLCFFTGNDALEKQEENEKNLFKVNDKMSDSSENDLQIEGAVKQTEDLGPPLLLPTQVLPSSSTRDSTKSLVNDSDNDSGNRSFLSEDGIRNRDVAKTKAIEESNNEAIQKNITSNVKSPQLKKKIRKAHMGIKYKFEMDRFSLRDLRVHAQHFLNATHTHSEDDASKVIKLNQISMDYKQLNNDIGKRGKTKNNGNASQKEIFQNKNESDKNIDVNEDDRGGSYCDEIMDRIKEHVKYEVLSKNKLSLASNIFGAAANHTVSVVRDFANPFIKKGVPDSVYAHNPKQFMYMANRALRKKSTKDLPFSNSKISKVHIRLLEGRNIKLSNQRLRTPLVCSFRLTNESNSSKAFSLKSHPKKCNDCFIVTWDQRFSLAPVNSADTLLHVRVFEFHMIKDVFICEFYVPLSGLFCKLSTEYEGKEEDVPIEIKTENDVAEGYCGPLLNIVDCNIINDYIGIDSSVSGNGDVSKPTENAPVLTATPEEKGGGVNINLQIIDDYNGSSMENYEEDTGLIEAKDGNLIDKEQNEEKHGLFSWQSIAGHIKGHNTKILESNDPDDERPFTHNDKTPITSAFSHIFSSAHAPVKAAKTIANLAANVGTTPSLVSTKDMKALPTIIEKETISWHKCYGRGEEEKDVEKGEICLGLFLESSEII